MTGDLYIVGALVLVVVGVAAVIGFAPRAHRRDERDRVKREEAEQEQAAERVAEREARLAGPSQEARSLYQLLERQDRAFEHQIAQGRHLGRIASWVTFFGIV